jgi:hypothetical protein
MPEVLGHRPDALAAVQQRAREEVPSACVPFSRATRTPALRPGFQMFALKEFRPTAVRSRVVAIRLTVAGGPSRVRQGRSPAAPAAGPSCFHASTTLEHDFAEAPAVARAR